MRRLFFVLIALVLFQSFAGALVYKDRIGLIRVVSEETISVWDGTKLWTEKDLNLPFAVHDFTVKNGVIHAIYKDKNSYNYVFSSNNGRSFGYPLTLNQSPLKRVSPIFVSDNLLQFAAIDKEGKKIDCFESLNSGASFSKTEIDLDGFRGGEEILALSGQIILKTFENNRSKIHLFKKTDGVWKNYLLYEGSDIIGGLKLKVLDNDLFLLSFKANGLTRFGILPQLNQVIAEKVDDFFYDNKKLYWVSNEILHETIIDLGIELIKPMAGQWFKPNSSLVIEVKNILPGTKVLVDNQFTEVKFSSKGTGFLSLGAFNLKEGKHIIEVRSEPLISRKSYFLIDSTPPSAIPPQSPTAEKDKVALNYIENGSGIDLQSSLIEISSGTLEVFGTPEVTGNSIAFIPSAPLKFGSYKIKTILRDKAGNSAAPQEFSLLVGDSISAKGAKSIGSAVIKSGPNPFNPESEEWKLTCTLTSPLETKLFIFSLTGRNIWSISSPSKDTHTLSWNGKDTSGSHLPNGVYLYALLAGGQVERGRIIIFR